MKPIFYLLILFSFQLNAQVFVNSSATGSNDGSTWANAFTSLDDAINLTTSGDIWIATGTYSPAGAAMDSYFEIMNDINLYGGFAGTESSIDERDISANPTIITGDYNGDDIDFVFDEARLENAQTLFYVDSLLTSVTFDGLTICHANGSLENEDVDGNPLPEIMWAGGGIFSYSTLNVTNCNFHNNAARRGAGVCIIQYNGGGNGSVFENNIFEKSFSNSQASGIFMNGVDGAEIMNTTFTNNLTSRGALYPLFCNGVSIRECEFSDNLNTGGFGGAFFVWNNTNFLFENNEVFNNSSGNAGAAYIDGREFLAGSQSANNLIVRNNNFYDNNTQGGFGGAIYTWETSALFENNIFDNNHTNGGDGGALFNGSNSGNDREFIIKGNTFSKNSANFAGAITAYGVNGEYTIENNTFDDNTAGVTGGSALNGFGSNVTYINNTFSQDSARFGASVGTQNNGTVTFQDCRFESGIALDNGGALNVLFGSTVNIENCEFEFNDAAIFGGVINASRAGDTIAGSLNISNSRFINNTVGTQGAAVNTFDFNLNMTNNILAFNSNFGEGAGGALSLNAGDTFPVTANLINNTIADNFAVIGAGLAVFTDEGAGSTLDVNLQNNIFSNPDGTNYEVEDGTPNVISIGGNLSDDSSTDDILTGMNDISDSADPEFHDRDDLDYYPDQNSPAIDIGIADGASEFDINGNPRVGAPDAGAIEFDINTSINETIIENDGLLIIKENPVNSILSFEITNQWKDRVYFEIVSNTGQRMIDFNFEKQALSESYTHDVRQLATGSYFLVARGNNQAIVTKMIKI